MSNEEKQLKLVELNPIKIDLILKKMELERKKIDQTVEVVDYIIRERYLSSFRERYSSLITCMPSRDSSDRIKAYSKKMIAERGEFIKKYPILNPPPPKLN